MNESLGDWKQAFVLALLRRKEYDATKAEAEKLVEEIGTLQTEVTDLAKRLVDRGVTQEEIDAIEEAATG